MRLAAAIHLFALVLHLDVVAGLLPLALRPRLPLISADTSISANLSGSGIFSQLIDHSNPGLGNFSQRYWFNSTNWGGPGYPVVLFTPGETAADKYGTYLTERAIIGLFGKASKAAVVMIEHRYWGASTPFKIQDTKALQYHTLENAVADLVNFARNVKLPFDQNSRSNAPQAPWIMTGGSYSGALAAWVAKLSPGTYWAYSASSAPVQAINDFWQYFEPIKEGMPKNCSTNFVNIIKYVDSVLLAGNRTEINGLKAKFGMADLTHDDDFASALSVPLGEWQSTSFTTGHSTFFQMCDAIQGVPTNDTVGLKRLQYEQSVSNEVAVKNLAAWMKNIYLTDYCLDNYKYDEYRPRGSTGCLDSYNASAAMYRDQSSNNTFNRQWFWMLCNEPFYYWQTAAPPDRPSMVSRLVTPEYFARQCPLFFPAQDGVSFGGVSKRDRLGGSKTIDMLNGRTGGWLLNDTQRLMWINGEFDPWRAASVSSKHRPGGPLASAKQAPVFLIKNGSHCSDISISNGGANPEVRKLQDALINQIRDWVDEFWAINGRPERKKSGAARGVKTPWAA